MHLWLRFLFCLAALAFAGCGTIRYERARLEGAHVSNPTLGRGVYYQLPDGYAQLNPWSPVPPKPENREFERFLRGVIAANDQIDPHMAFREALLFRNEDRYLAIIHLVMNLPCTFNTLPPGKRAELLPLLASETYLYFKVPREDFTCELCQLSGFNAARHPPFRLALSSPAGKAGPTASDWRGVGCSFMGAGKDLAFVLFFARQQDIPLAQAELDLFMADFRYGRPRSRP